MRHAGIGRGTRGVAIGLAIGLTFGLAACTPSGRLQPDSPGPQIDSDGSCHAERVAWAVGQPGDEKVLARVWKESGAGLIRPIGPGQAVTHDFKSDRINVHLDGKNVIVSVNCG